MADAMMQQSGIDPYIFWLLGIGRPYYFLPGRQERGREWIPVLLRLKGFTPQEFADGLHIVAREKRAAWRGAVRVPSFYMDPMIAPAKDSYITAMMQADYLLKDFAEDEELRADIRRAVETVTPGLTLDKSSLPPPKGEPLERPRKAAARAAEPAAPANTVVMGIIDDGIAFAHERFRKLVGGTVESRVANWWLQDGPYDPLGNVPYGYELTRADINTLLATCTNGGVIDEDLVYRQAHLIDFKQEGHKSAAWRIAHGTHVMDLACGFDPDPPRHDRPIIAVQLPTRVTADTSGASLFPAVLDAMRFILLRANAIPGAANAPIVINLSYGRLEGPHDGTADLELAIQALVALSGDRLRVVLPAGNSHLSRIHAQVTFATANESRELRWRVLPDDKTPSFVEIWLPQRSFTAAFPSRLTVTITSPVGESHTIREFDPPVSWGASPFYAEAYFYYSFLTGRTMFRISARPTADLTPGAPLSPAGIWRIKLENIDLTGQTVHGWVQRDDSLYGFPLRGRQSFFDDPAYVRFNNAGRDKETDDPGVRVRRESTLNSIASGPSWIFPATRPRLLVAGGYLRKEVRPAKYSSAGASLASGGPPPRWPDAVTASEDSGVHQGVLAAGSRSGAVVPLGGTSVAAPQMARWIADDIAAGGLGNHAAVAAAATPMPFPPEVVGAGRLVTAPIVNVKRHE